jgi:hypothetical protein
MSSHISPALKALELARNGEGARAYKTPDSILKSDAKNEAFSREYARFKRNQFHFDRLMATPNSYPLMCDLFDAIKAQVSSMSIDDIWSKEVGEYVAKCVFFGRTWTITFLTGGMSRTNEVYLAVGHPEPIHVPLVVLAFDIPEHWEF